MPFKWECPACSPKGYRFSVLVGTIFENTNVPMKTWFKVIYLMLTSKKGIAALQVHRMFGFGSYRPRMYMCHRVRAGLADPQFRKLMGIVEVDETYIGGKNKNRHWDKRTPGTGGEGKDTVVGAVSARATSLPAFIEHADTETLNSFIREAVSEKVSLIATDEHPGNCKFEKHGTCGTPLANTLTARCTLRPLMASGRCLSAASWAASTRSAANICRCTSRNSSSATTIATTLRFSRRP